MINFRYHIVSLMAVFLALAVGIVLGVTLVSGEANKGLAAQAEQDRKLVQSYREQLTQQQAVNSYRDRYAEQLRKMATDQLLSNTDVAVITMPGAPTSTVNDIKTAVNDAGGRVTSQAAVSENVFDHSKDEASLKAVNDYSDLFEAQRRVSTKVGRVLGRALLSQTPSTPDDTALRIRRSLTSAGLADIDAPVNSQAQLAIVVTAEATDPTPATDVLLQHVEFDLAVSQAAKGTVLAGPNSAQIEGTDVSQARVEPNSREQLSTVDVADLPSGVTTVVLAGKEQLLDGPSRQGHYGAAPSSDAPAPQLPIR